MFAIDSSVPSPTIASNTCAFSYLLNEHVAQLWFQRFSAKQSQLAHQVKSYAGNVAEEEVMYTLFNLAQFLGYIEVVRREGPREDAFLQAGNPQGSDTLATLVEGLRFVMSAASGNLVVSALNSNAN